MSIKQLAAVIAVMALAMTSTGCGIIGWSLSPRNEVESYTVPRAEEVTVRSFPPGAMVVVDGAEAGPTPRTVKVPLSEVRHQRRQSIVPGLIGLVLDTALFGAATAICASENAAECTVIAASGGLALILTGTYLNFGRAASNDATDVLPGAFDIGVRHPGYQEQTRRIRVPDLTEVDFLLTPVDGQAPNASPGSAPPPAPDAPTRAPADPGKQGR